MARIQTVPEPRLRRRALHALERALYWSGAAWGYNTWRGTRGATILMYHSVAPPPIAQFIDPVCHITPEHFEGQMAWVAKNRTVVSLDALVDMLDADRTPPRGTVAITFDDGYLDNLEVAAPILEAHNLPATFYLPTGYIEDGEPQWVDQLYTSFNSRRHDRLELPELGRFDLADPRARIDGYHAASMRLITAGRAARAELLKEIKRQLDPSQSAPRLTMNWEDVERMSRQYPKLDIGIHTVDHADLSRCSLEEARHQIEHAVLQVEQHIGHRPRHFSFPYSRATDATRQLVKDLGFRSAIGSGTDILVTAKTDRFNLARLDPTTSPTLFKFWTSGAYPALPRELTGRA